MEDPNKDLMEASFRTDMTEIVLAKPGQSTIDREAAIRLSHFNIEEPKNQNFMGSVNYD